LRDFYNIRLVRNRYYLSTLQFQIVYVTRDSP